MDEDMRLLRLESCVEFVVTGLTQTHQRRILRTERDSRTGLAVIHRCAGVDPGEVVIGVIHGEIFNRINIRAQATKTESRLGAFERQANPGGFGPTVGLFVPANLEVSDRQCGR